MKTREKLKSLSVRKQDKGVHISSPEKKKSFGIKTFIINCITPGWQFSFSLCVLCLCKQSNTYAKLSVYTHVCSLPKKLRREISKKKPPTISACVYRVDISHFI